ncbi:uncharacterized protein LOC125384143 [Haliotis rufescens]|uniref:uncharacterized protein LOC124121755 n=1 Tax=Haliotis rufescens TaxID=6454 RepID=UPI001EB079EB|nr:uncharacterized protein LOC124121755 [Haliotis rufescens]XP_046340769.1 uncharacterized protein LOC124121756 [Haliotis rufescens]XP_048258577.1 uncharacterized protein LOC125384143 [Haliotis rufescens]
MRTAIILPAAILACLCVISDARYIRASGLQVQPRTVKGYANQQPRVIIINQDKPRQAARVPTAARSGYAPRHGNGYNNFLNDYLLADALDINHPGLLHGFNQIASPYAPSARTGRNSYDPLYAALILDQLDAQPIGASSAIVG